jgi:hypothetical protein
MHGGLQVVLPNYARLNSLVNRVASQNPATHLFRVRNARTARQRDAHLLRAPRANLSSTLRLGFWDQLYSVESFFPNQGAQSVENFLRQMCRLLLSGRRRRLT